MHKLPELTYGYDALEPYIDARTMEIHHTKHHNGYVNNLNAALEKAGTQTQSLALDTLLRNINEVPDVVRTAVRNNGGGHYNHSLFWTVMTKGGGGKPTGDLAGAIDKTFGSFDDFKTKFTQTAATRFGSGWAWLYLTRDNKLDVYSTPNQDNPLIDGKGTPILGLDVWEHAYYLNYQNKRPDYIEAFFNVVDWSEVARRYAELT